MKNKNISASSQESDYDFLERTIGPGTWIYDILQDREGQQKDWDLLQDKLKKCGKDENKKRAITKSFRFLRHK